MIGQGVNAVTSEVLAFIKGLMWQSRWHLGFEGRGNALVLVPQQGQESGEGYSGGKGGKGEGGALSMHVHWAVVGLLGRAVNVGLWQHVMHSSTGEGPLWRNIHDSRSRSLLTCRSDATWRNIAVVVLCAPPPL